MVKARPKHPTVPRRCTGSNPGICQKQLRFPLTTIRSLVLLLSFLSLSTGLKYYLQTDRRHFRVGQWVGCANVCGCIYRLSCPFFLRNILALAYPRHRGHRYSTQHNMGTVSSSWRGERTHVLWWWRFLYPSRSALATVYTTDCVSNCASNDLLVFKTIGPHGFYIFQ
eukprot:SAG11_NODE_11598_length_750_cov_1.027650_1_plen_168_part_00